MAPYCQCLLAVLVFAGVVIGVDHSNHAETAAAELAASQQAQAKAVRERRGWRSRALTSQIKKRSAAAQAQDDTPRRLRERRRPWTRHAVRRSLPCRSPLLTLLFLVIAPRLASARPLLAGAETLHLCSPRTANNDRSTGNP